MDVWGILIGLSSILFVVLPLLGVEWLLIVVAIIMGISAFGLIFNVLRDI